MEVTHPVIAIFADSGAAVKKLTDFGFEMKHLSVVGKNYHTEGKAIGFYNIGDRIRFWGTRGAFWGGLWGLFFGGLFLTIPLVGHVRVLSYLAATAFSAIESAVLTGGVSALGAILYSIWTPKNSVVQYQTALKADGSLMMVYGGAPEIARGKALLAMSKPSSVEKHQGTSMDLMVHANG